MEMVREGSGEMVRESLLHYLQEFIANTSESKLNYRTAKRAIVRRFGEDSFSVHKDAIQLVLQKATATASAEGEVARHGDGARHHHLTERQQIQHLMSAKPKPIRERSTSR